MWLALLDRLTGSSSTVATAESLTGGLLAGGFTALPGSSACFVGGVVSYWAEIKHDVLHVPQQVIEEHGVVSGECAAAMAVGVRNLMGTTYGVSTTGVAGPEPQEDKEPGTVWIAVAGPSGVVTRLLDLSGDRETIRRDTCHEAMSLLDGILLREEPMLG